ncbi:hypothetical protein KIL84_015576 [Mauremys mutica]|uniref:Uncharacterized protein n=1 Tax=Mauremys mutica TaxID=74926 RepID=A0A9D3WMH8_9SAUR|nr:hypothetical protein KIL84_015576 [Mauremys mutica]
MVRQNFSQGEELGKASSSPSFPTNPPRLLWLLGPSAGRGGGPSSTGRWIRGSPAPSGASHIPSIDPLPVTCSLGLELQLIPMWVFPLPLQGTAPQFFQHFQALLAASIPKGSSLFQDVNSSRFVTGVTGGHASEQRHRRACPCKKWGHQTWYSKGALPDCRKGGHRAACQSRMEP